MECGEASCGCSGGPWRATGALPLLVLNVAAVTMGLETVAVVGYGAEWCVLYGAPL